MAMLFKRQVGELPFRLRHAIQSSRGASRESMALLRDRGIHPASLHHALRWPEA